MSPTYKQLEVNIRNLKEKQTKMSSLFLFHENHRKNHNTFGWVYFCISIVSNSLSYSCLFYDFIYHFAKSLF